MKRKNNTMSSASLSKLGNDCDTLSAIKYYGMLGRCGGIQPVDDIIISFNGRCLARTGSMAANDKRR